MLFLLLTLLTKNNHKLFADNLLVDNITRIKLSDKRRMEVIRHHNVLISDEKVNSHNGTVDIGWEQPHNTTECRATQLSEEKKL